MTDLDTETVEAKESTGAFRASLKRNNRQIRDDRADAIAEDAEVLMKRRIEDLRLEIRKQQRIRENMLDLSPTNSMSLMVAEDFDGNEFVNREMAIGIALRELGIKLEVMTDRYKTLFGDI